jgi:hypothetical protein
MRPSPEEIARRVQATVSHNVEQFGLHVQYVFGSEDGTPSFIYTVGMTNLGAPELIVFGLSPEMVHGALNQIYMEISLQARPKDEKKISDQWSVTMLLEEVERTVATEYTTFTEMYFKGSGKQPTYKQLVWPDEHGKYPHQHGFSKKLRAAQPYIGKREPRLDDDCGVSYFS